MKNEPKVIYLNIGAVEGDEPTDFKDCHAVTWSEDHIYTDDIKYIHHSEVDEKVKEAVKIALQIAAEKATCDDVSMTAMPEYEVDANSILSLDQEVLEKLNVKYDGK